MDLDDVQPSAFLVPRRQWQAAFLYRLMDTKYPDKVGAVPMLERLRERNWSKHAINAMTNEDTAWIVANIDSDFKSAHDEVLAYLRRLRADDVVHEDRGNRFYITQATLKRVADGLIHIEPPGEASGASRGRFEGHPFEKWFMCSPRNYNLERGKTVFKLAGIKRKIALSVFGTCASVQAYPRSRPNPCGGRQKTCRRRRTLDLKDQAFKRRVNSSAFAFVTPWGMT